MSLVVGAGPAGSVAATVLARAGARVRLLDRATFPRDKLCGDTVNPGTLALLRRARPVAGDRRARAARRRHAASPASAASRSTAAIRDGLSGRAIAAARSRLDAPAAGDRRRVRSSRPASPSGARSSTNARRPSSPASSSAATAARRRCRARDDRGRRPAFDDRVRPRPRAASGAAAALGDRRLLRERAVGDQRSARRTFERLASPRVACSARCTCAADRYIGVAPVPGGLTNVCLVRPSGAGDAALARSRAALLIARARARSAAARSLRGRAARRAARRARTAGRRRPRRTRSTGCCSPATPPASSIR